MRSLSGKSSRKRVADRCVRGCTPHAADTESWLAEGGRALIYYAALKADTLVHGATEQEKAQADDDLGF